MAVTRSQQAAGGKKPTPIKKASPRKKRTPASPKNFICPPAPPTSPQPGYRPQAKVKKQPWPGVTYKKQSWPVTYKTTEDSITAIIVAPLVVKEDFKAGVKELVDNLPGKIARREAEARKEALYVKWKNWYGPKK